MILLIDNYDSFTYNIYQIVRQLGKEVKVVRNDAITIEEIQAMNPEAIILSSGPKKPVDAGISLQVVKELYEKIPILGIGLGHHIIAEAFDSSIVEAKSIKHGKTSSLTHKGIGPFSYLEQPLEAMRYHSYVVEKESLPDDLKVIANTMDDQDVMAIQHREYPVYGLQFQPESIGTPSGDKIFANFLNETEKGTDA